MGKGDGKEREDIGKEYSREDQEKEAWEREMGKKGRRWEGNRREEKERNTWERKGGGGKGIKRREGK